ncbi:CLUMA_CG018851, isoform A [Clunio marinus]|uniref:CLUMA_CG018851, isoform A n=1 Tax=Clunio marinus TaxID=568069 RepID=A0A1J1J0G3_9DIPT|nr:CLUMA_CG018851, isoform A [Clunio marinus]
MEIRPNNINNQCSLCGNNGNEIELTNIELNSLKCGNNILEFSSLISELLFCNLPHGYVCSECLQRLVEFYLFKNIVDAHIKNPEIIQKLQIVNKLNSFLDDFEYEEKFAVLRYNQCFTVVPESKRSLMENFQNWQPRVMLQKNQDEKQRGLKDQKPIMNFEIKSDINDYEEVIYLEENFDENVLEEKEESLKQEDSKIVIEIDNEMKTKTQDRQWANEATKSCYSIKESNDSIIPIWTCCYCRKIYQSAQAMRFHLLAKHLQNINEGKNKSNLQTNEEMKWIKNETNSRKTTSGSFESHLNESHLENVQSNVGKIKKTMHDLRWTCIECCFKFSSQRTFNSHLKLHEKLKGLISFTEIFYCEQCQMFFRNTNDLNFHKSAKNHEDRQSVLIPATGIALQKTISFKRLSTLPGVDNNQGDLMCGHCGKKFSNENSSKIHLLIHHINPLICPKDGRQFNSMHPYLLHLQRAHSDLCPEFLLCTHCKFSFDNIYEKLAHMKQCNEKKFSCDHCDKKFSNKTYLNSHLRREMGLLNVTCQYCDKIFKGKDELKTHMRSHTKERPYKCPICNKCYTTTSARSSHMETHKNTMIQCEICSVKFVARRHYILHYRRYHDDNYRQKKLQEQTCQYCGKQFLRRDHFREHLQKSHNKEI